MKRCLICQGILNFPKLFEVTTISDVPCLHLYCYYCLWVKSVNPFSQLSDKSGSLRDNLITNSKCYNWLGP